MSSFGQNKKHVSDLWFFRYKTKGGQFVESMEGQIIYLTLCFFSFLPDIHLLLSKTSELKNQQKYLVSIVDVIYPKCFKP